LCTKHRKNSVVPTLGILWQEQNFFPTFRTQSTSRISHWQAVAELGLKRKFSFSYFRENFAKICFRFSRKKLMKIFAKTLTKTKIVAKNDAGSENVVKYPNYKRQMKFRCWRNAVDQRIREMFRIKWEKLCKIIG
jgi:hypothetical protein